MVYKANVQRPRYTNRREMKDAYNQHFKYLNSGITVDTKKLVQSVKTFVAKVRRYFFLFQIRELLLLILFLYSPF